MKKKNKRNYENSKPMELPAKYEAGFIDMLDKRTETYQLLHTAFTEVTDDLGGLASLSHTHKCLAERFVFLEFVLRSLETRIAENPKKSDELFARWIQGLNSITGLARSVGLERRVKKIESLQSYVKDKRSRKSG